MKMFNLVVLLIQVNEICWIDLASNLIHLNSGQNKKVIGLST